MKLFSELRGAITASGYSHREIARMIGRGPTYFSHCLTGQAEWELRDAYAICDALGLSYTELPRYFPKGGRADRKLKAVG